MGPKLAGFDMIITAFMLTASAQSQQQKPDAPARVEEDRLEAGKSLGFTEQLLARKIDEECLRCLMRMEIDRITIVRPRPCSPVPHLGARAKALRDLLEQVR